MKNIIANRPPTARTQGNHSTRAAPRQPIRAPEVGTAATDAPPAKIAKLSPPLPADKRESAVGISYNVPKL